MSERGAEGILRRQAEAKAAAKPATTPQPVDQGTAGHKPGRVKGAAAGAATGAVGGPGGAFLGGLAGGLTGGKGKSRSASGRRALVAEFVICMALLGLSPMVDKGGDITTSKFMKKASATAAVFIVLGFISSAGDTARKVANGLGLLMTLTVLLNERSAFGALVKAVNGDGVKISLPSGSQSGFSNEPAPGTTGALGQPLSLQDQWELGGDFASNAGTWLHNLFTGGNVGGGVPQLNTEQGETDYLNLFGVQP
jgi:hypothetical protein